MDENVLAPVIRCDESVALGRIEPFHLTRWHVASPCCELMNGMVTEIGPKKKPVGMTGDIKTTRAIDRSSELKLRGEPMADADLETLMAARAALTKQRLSWAQAIAAAGELPEAAIKAINEVQQAIEVIDIAIEELGEAQLEEELEETEEDEDE